MRLHLFLSGTAIVIAILVGGAFISAPYVINNEIRKRGFSPFPVPALTSMLKGGNKEKTVPIGFSVLSVRPAWASGPAIAITVSLDGERDFAAQILQPSGRWDYLIDGPGNNLYLQPGSTIQARAQDTHQSFKGVVTIKTDENGSLFDCVDKNFAVNFEAGAVDPTGAIPFRAEIANPKECNGYVRGKIEDVFKGILSPAGKVPNSFLCRYRINISRVAYYGDIQNDDVRISAYFAYGISPLCSRDG